MVIDHRHIRRLLRFWPMNKVLTQKDEFTEKMQMTRVIFLLQYLISSLRNDQLCPSVFLHPWISCGPRSIEPSLIITRDENLKQS
nr:unnamed protein product [Brassica rapa]